MRGKEVLVRAIVGLSAHANHLDSLRWLRGIVESPPPIQVVHGEPKPADMPQETIAPELGWNAAVARDPRPVSLYLYH